ncbi:hypothetical protein ACIPY0_20485 [Paenarthrobacter nicotinovorans]|uniref:hypothetical protein n=1 Tax=Paenarthrobacter nicotinovorans TaxID=29320 RepID=UPI003813A156
METIEQLTTRTAWNLNNHGTINTRNHADAIGYLHARRAELTTAADNCTHAAAAALGVGDNRAAAAFMAEAREFMNEIATIQALAA